MKANIVPALEPLAVPIGEVRTLEGNPRRGDVEAIARSLERFGQRKPVVVRRDTGEVLAGNHTLAAAGRLGWDTVAAIYVTDDEREGMAFALADNRLGDLATYDEDALAAMLDTIAADRTLVEATGWTTEEMSALLADAAAAAERAGEHRGGERGARGAPGSIMDRSAHADGDAPEPVRSLILTYERDTFAELVGVLEELRRRWESESYAEAVARALAEAPR